MFDHTVTARFDDIDYAGRVFYGRLFNYVHVTEEEWFEEMGYPIDRLDEAFGILFPVAHTEGDFRGPVEIGDEIEVRVGVSSIGTKSFDVRALAENATCGYEAFEIDVTRVCVSTSQEGTTERIPDEFRDAIEAYRWE